MRAALIAALILLLPSALLAGGTMGIFFDYRAAMTYAPKPYEIFKGYVYGDQLQCNVAGVEFRIDSVPGIEVLDLDVTPGLLWIGAPYQGLAISYWPPLNGFSPGYNLLCTITFEAAENWCQEYGGALYDGLLAVKPSGESGFLGETCWPEGSEIPVTGMTSVLCPSACMCIKTQSKSWGAIKSLF